MWSVLLCLVFAGGSLAEELESRLIQISQGPVRGYKDTDEEVFIFRSIPYATAPTGVHRYKVMKLYQTIHFASIILSSVGISQCEDLGFNIVGL